MEISRFLRRPSIRRGLFTSLADEHEFFSWLRMSNQTFKTTSSGRLADVDDWLTGHMLAAGNGAETETETGAGTRAGTRVVSRNGDGVGRRWSVLDVGVSSGSTTMDLDEALIRRGLTADILGIDRSLFVDLRRSWLWAVAILSDRDFIYQFDCGPFGFCNTQLENTRFGPLVLGLAGWLLRSGLLRCERIPFVGPRARAAGSRVRFEEGDMIGGPLPGGGAPFDVVRVMNVLNLAYFEEPVIDAAARTLAGWVADGGLLLVGRSDGETNRVTLFRKTGTGMTVVDRLNGGSEVERHILAQTP